MGDGAEGWGSAAERIWKSWGLVRWVVLAAAVVAFVALVGPPIKGLFVSPTPSEPAKTWSPSGNVPATVNVVLPPASAPIVQVPASPGVGGTARVAGGDNGGGDTIVYGSHIQGGDGPSGGDAILQSGKGGPNGKGGSAVMISGSLQAGKAIPATKPR